MTLKMKIFIHFLLTSVLAMVLMYIYIWSYLEDKFVATYFEKLTISREIKKDQIESYFHNLKSDISILSQNPYVLKLAKSSMRNEDNLTLEKAYLAEYQKEKNYSNIFITSVKEKKLTYSSMSQMSTSCTFFETICKEFENSKNKNIIFLDFKYYKAFDTQPASFIAKAIYDKDTLLGVLVIHISIDTINSIMTGKNQWTASGYENTGETYIVGQDCKMRNDSRFFIEDRNNYLYQVKKNGLDLQTIKTIKKNDTTVLLQDINRDLCSKLSQNSSNTEITTDYRGVEVLSSQAIFDLYGVHWMILSEIDKDEVYEPINKLKTKITLILLIIFISVLASTFVFSRQITKQLILLKNGFDLLAKGDLTKKVEILSNDEFGELSKKFNDAIVRLVKLKKSVKHYTKLSEVDTLTQIFNRRKIDEILDMYLENYQQEEISLIMFDIDFFKKINDTYGHDVGDYALVELTKLISKHIRSEDFIARWGGEEFLIVLIDMNLDNAYLLSKKLRRIVSSHKFEPFNKMTCSFGVTSAKDKDTKNSLLKRVDDALYQAKNTGRDKVSIIR